MPVIKHKAQRVGVFIDTQNIYHSAKNIHHAKANFAAIMKEAVDGRVLIRAMAYVVTTESGEESAFFGALEKAGIEVRSKPLQIFLGGAKKADWDVGLAIDAVTLAPKLDSVILLTGDGDFVPLVKYLQNTHGCQVEVVTFGRSASGRLIEACDDFLDLDKNPRKYLIMGGNGTRAPRRDTRPQPADAGTEPAGE